MSSPVAPAQRGLRQEIDTLRMVDLLEQLDMVHCAEWRLANRHSSYSTARQTIDPPWRHTFGSSEFPGPYIACHEYVSRVIMEYRHPLTENHTVSLPSWHSAGTAQNPKIGNL